MTGADLLRAASLIREGGVVIYPTETVYGIGASISSPAAVSRVFEIKRRSKDKPISVAVASLDMISSVASVDESEMAILRDLLPGPVSFLVKARDDLLPEITAGSRKVGIRLPMHPMALKLIEASGPITSTSANQSGSPPPASVDEIDPMISSAVDMVLDGGSCSYAEPSTLVDLDTRKILRKGAWLNRVVEAIR